MASILRLVRAAREGTRAVLGSGRIARGGAEGRGLAAFTGFSSPGGVVVPFGPRGSDGLPTFVDWNAYGAVTPIQDQGDCGACWAFGVTGLIEVGHFIKHKELIKLSEQHLIDANNLRNFGCEGGSPLEALEYIKRNGGIINSESYPYMTAQGPPQSIKAHGVMINDYIVTYNVSQRMLKRAVAQAPVLACIGADADFLINYGGVLDGPGYTLDDMENLRMSHAILIIGYGETVLGEKVWLAKGCHGGDTFLLLARDTDEIGGAFGITRRITQVDVSGRVVVTVKSDQEMGVIPRTNYWSV